MKIRLLKEKLLDHYKVIEPHPFIQFDVFSDPESFDGIVSPDKNGYCSFTAFTYELMTGSYGVRILINPKTPKDKVIGSLKKVVEWISESKVLEGHIEKFKEEQKAKKIEEHLIAAGYSEEDMSDFCRFYQT